MRAMRLHAAETRLHNTLRVNAAVKSFGNEQHWVTLRETKEARCLRPALLTSHLPYYIAGQSFSKLRMRSSNLLTV